MVRGQRSEIISRCFNVAAIKVNRSDEAVELEVSEGLYYLMTLALLPPVGQ